MFCFVFFFFYHHVCSHFENLFKNKVLFSRHYFVSMFIDYVHLHLLVMYLGPEFVSVLCLVLSLF